jgi:hypothetical protein
VPAGKEEFEVEPETDDEESTAAKLKKQAEAKKADAQALLEKRLVFVRNLEKYFDTERHRVILTEAGLRHQFQPMMPRRSRGKLDPVELLRDSTTKRYVDSLGFHPGEGPDVHSERRHLCQLVSETGYQSRLNRLLRSWKRSTGCSVGSPMFPYREWLVQFYAHVVQYPGVKIKSPRRSSGRTYKAMGKRHSRKSSRRS